MILSQQLLMNTAKDPSKIALRYLGKDTTFIDFRNRISRLSYLYIHEYGHGNRIAFVCRNSPAVALSFFAFTNTCSSVVPVDPDLAPKDIADWIRSSKATHIAVTGDLVQKVREICSAERIPLPLIEIERKQGGEYDPSFTPPPEHIPKENDTVLLLRTQGASGREKFAQFNHKQIAAAALALKIPYHLLPTDRFTTQMNWAHPFALLHSLIFPLMSGATIVIDHGLENLEYADFLTESRITRLVGTPPLFHRLRTVLKSDNRSMPGMKTLVVGLGELSEEDYQGFKNIKVPVAHCYGQTEALWTISMEDYQKVSDHREKKTVGGPLTGFKYKVVDGVGDEIEGESSREGRFAVSGTSFMQSYLGLEKETRNALRGSWLYTGDYARLEGADQDLQIVFLGRAEELIIDGSDIMSVDDVDWALRNIPGAEDGAGFILKDMRDNPVIACAVVKVQNHPTNEKTILEVLAQKLSPAKLPKVVVFTDQIPRDKGGNVNRMKLKGQFSGAAG